MISSPKTRVSKQIIEKRMSTSTGISTPVCASATVLDSPAVSRHDAPLLSSSWSGMPHAKRDALVEKLRNKEYRDAYVHSTVVHGLAHQIRINREQRHFSQAELARKCGGKTTQISISRLEDPAYGTFTFKSILKVASALDVAVVFKLVPYSKFILESADKSVSGLLVKSFSDEDLHTRQAMVTISVKTDSEGGNYFMKKTSVPIGKVNEFTNQFNPASHEVEYLPTKLNY